MPAPVDVNHRSMNESNQKRCAECERTGGRLAAVQKTGSRNMADSWCCCFSRRFVNSGFISRHTRLLDLPEVQLDTTRMGKFCIKLPCF